MTVCGVIRKEPGMVSVQEMPVLQNGLPQGGFLPVRYARRILTNGPGAAAIFLTAFGIFAYGMYQVGQGNKIRRAQKEEKYAARRAIILILQAGWKVGESVYNSGRWVPPVTGGASTGCLLREF